ncbi:unnamed protein product [Paramecium pentaurelia]|uniref:Uncharacterized protein n=1 Tax=Paramecium pentaurelia TaxID=43138 RepID=A0A8S1XAK1_9CILI|nr:unnamed protein product [Paramecium pentaurelia]
MCLLTYLIQNLNLQEKIQQQTIFFGFALLEQQLLTQSTILQSNFIKKDKYNMFDCNTMNMMINTMQPKNDFQLSRSSSRLDQKQSIPSNITYSKKYQSN